MAVVQGPRGAPILRSEVVADRPPAAPSAAPGGTAPGGPGSVDRAVAMLDPPADGTMAATAAAAAAGPGSALERFAAVVASLPGGGHRAAARFELLAEVGAVDLSVVRLLEGHLDALAVLAELGGPLLSTGELLGVWASKADGRRVRARRTDPGWELSGSMAYCSGVGALDRALVVADDGGDDRLFLVDLRQPGIRTDPGSWPALGMEGTRSETVELDRVPTADAVGGAGDYVGRAGFWAGSVGVAACWAGGALGLVRAGRDALGTGGDDHQAAHLGAAAGAWVAAWSLLAAVGDRVDARTVDELLAHLVRGEVEAACQRVVHHVGRLAGPGLFVRRPQDARRVPDLLTYLRQHHGELDWARAGRRLGGPGTGS